MKRSLQTALLAALLAAGGAAQAHDRPKAAKPKKVEHGASCKAPAVGTCAACSITCRTGETVTCAAGVTVGDVCHTPPSCRCAR